MIYLLIGGNILLDSPKLYKIFILYNFVFILIWVVNKVVVLPYDNEGEKMAVNFKDEAPELVKDFLFYMQTVKEKSSKTVSEYFLDLRMFFRFVKVLRGTAKTDDFDKIKVPCVLITSQGKNINSDYLSSVSTDDVAAAKKMTEYKAGFPFHRSCQRQ